MNGPVKMTSGWRVISPVAAGVSRGAPKPLSGLDDTLLDQPGERLVHRLERGVARAVGEEALGLGDAGAWAAGDVVEGRRGVLGLFVGLPRFEGQEFEPSLAPEPDR